MEIVEKTKTRTIKNPKDELIVWYVDKHNLDTAEIPLDLYSLDAKKRFDFKVQDIRKFAGCALKETESVRLEINAENLMQAAERFLSQPPLP